MKDLFNKPTPCTIAGVPVLVRKVTFTHFTQACSLATWFQDMAGVVDFEKIRAGLQPGSEHRQAVIELLQACIALPNGEAGESRPLTESELTNMPIVSLAEAVVEVLEVNTDFFFQTLPKLLAARKRILSTGSGLLSNSSELATAEIASAATP